MSEVLNLKMNGYAGLDTAAYFDGTSDCYLSIADSDAMHIAANEDYCLEGWFKWDGAPVHQMCVGAGYTSDLAISTSSGNIYVYYGGGATFNTGAAIPGKWYHIVVMRDSDVAYMYVNGIEINNTAYTAAMSPDTGYQFGKDPDVGQYFKGWMKNVRLTIGDSVYTGGSNFVPPTTLLESSGNTVFLLKMDEAFNTTSYTDSSSNAFTVTRNADVVQKNTSSWKNAGWTVDSSASAHVVSSVADAKPINPAINNRRRAYFFDGDSDYITLPTSSDWNFCASTSQDYTVDLWVKCDDHAGTESLVAQVENTNNFWELSHISGTGLRFLLISGGATDITVSGGEITDTEWHHVAVSKVTSAGPTVEYGIYLDGVQTAFVSDTSTDTFTGPIEIGRRTTDGLYFDGYMKNIRISNSNIFSAAPVVGLTDTIAVPSADPTAGANTKLLLTGEVSGLNTPLCSTAYFDGSDGYFSVADSPDWDFGTDPFTLEFWFRFTDTSTGVMLDRVNGAQFQMYYSGGSLGAYIASSNYGASFTPVLNQWYHFALVRAGTGANQTYFFIDGELKATGTNSSDLSSDQPIYIGTNTVGQEAFGYMKELRISSSARYTAAFTPSISPFTDDANTLLLCHFNGVPDDTDNTNGWMTDETGTHTLVHNGDAVCKFVEDYRNRTVKDESGQDHTGIMVGTAKNDWISVEGNGAGYFDGTGDYLTAPDSADWQLGDGNFTIGVWVKWNAFTAEDPILSQSNTAPPSQDTSNAQWLRINAGGTGLEWRAYESGGEIVNITSVFVGRVNEWYYVTVVRGWGGNANDYAICVNGSVIGTGTDASTLPNYTNTLNIGYDSYSGNQYLNGLLDALVINKGTAVWTAPFIPPTYPTSGASGNAFQAIIF